MTQPTPAWTLVRVTGAYTDLKGSTVTGHVTFTYRSVTKDHAARKIVFPAVFTATLTASAFTVVLPASDDPDIDGAPFVVTVSESLEIDGTRVGRPPFDVEISQTSPVSGTPPLPTLDLVDAGRATAPAAVATYVTRPELNAAIASVGGGSGGGVTSVDARTGAVVLTDRYDAIGAADTAKAAAITAAGTDATTKANNAVTTAANAAAALYVPLSQRGAASGVATLDDHGTIPAAQIASAPVLLLTAGDPVPPDTPPGTVIVRP